MSIKRSVSPYVQEEKKEINCTAGGGGALHRAERENLEGLSALFVLLPLRGYTFV